MPRALVAARTHTACLYGLLRFFCSAFFGGLFLWCFCRGRRRFLGNFFFFRFFFFRRGDRYRCFGRGPFGTCRFTLALVRAHIYAPPGKFCRKTDILPAFSYRKRKLVFWNDRARFFLAVRYFYLKDACRRQRMRDEFCRIFRPLDNIYFFSVQLVDDG